jgi:hypothetical protein
MMSGALAGIDRDELTLDIDETMGNRLERDGSA